MVKINRPRGTRDFLPEEMRLRRASEARLRDVVKRWGYREVKTPTFEQLKLFTAKSGDTILGEIYNFADKGNREMALRPELTAPVMRLYVEALQVSTKPCKLFYFDNCFRYERPQKGRFREFWQFGVELIGSSHPEAEAEVIALAIEMLSSVGVKGELRVGHLGIIRTVTNMLDTEQQAVIMHFVDKKDEPALKSYLKQIGAPIPLCEKLLLLINLSGTDAIPKAKEIVGDIIELNQFEEVISLLDALNVKYVVDFGIARGLDYYTGMVFEIYCEGLGAENQVCGGGSYSLAQLFGGSVTSSTGFGIGFDRIMEICTIVVPKTTLLHVVYFDDTLVDAVKITKKLREYTTVNMDVMRRRIKDQMSYANSTGANFVVIVGKDEVRSGKLAFKKMSTGEQELLTIEQIIELVKR
ncbi:MAG: histidine--tRNA ligase [Methanosarcinales archaeon]|nr:MAG: histidine--tRNA ligase [Methanosarcinales archaeon]